MSIEKNEFLVHAIPVLQDNIVWILVKRNQAIVIDPSVSEPIRNWLLKRKIELKAILQTHHHEDHIGGTQQLLLEWPSTDVIASKTDLDRIPLQNISVKHGDNLIILGYEVKVIEIPGHTSTHIGFFIKEPIHNKKPILFCGDTLFGGGCGRLFEGTPEEMFKSLLLLNSLPSETQIFCGHEYTEGNLKWANSLYPKDISIIKRLKEVSRKRSLGFLSLPSTLKEERETNLFIRAKSIKEFIILRKHKDNWKG